MNVEELRVDNIVFLTKDNFKTGRAYQLDAYDIYKLSESDCADVKPIPLTEEWLLKFGFVSNPYKDRYELIAKTNIIVECDKTKGVCILWCEQYPHIAHVNQLQNLYFALTGEELEIKQ